jgi:hypothetical protein
VSKKNRVGPVDPNQKSLKCQNYCQAGLLSKCTAGNTWKDQRWCEFSVKSSSGEYCMYYRKNFGGHCDCIKAQKAQAHIACRREK